MRYVPAFYPARAYELRYPGGLAVGGPVAGEVLGACYGSEQMVSIRKPLPRETPLLRADSAVDIAETCAAYEYQELRFDSASYIPYWKWNGMTDAEALLELFRGYHDGKKTKTRKR